MVDTNTVSAQPPVLVAFEEVRSLVSVNEGSVHIVQRRFKSHRTHGLPACHHGSVPVVGPAVGILPESETTQSEQVCFDLFYEIA